MNEENSENKLIRVGKKTKKEMVIFAMNGRPRQVPVAGNGSLSVSFSTSKSLKYYCVYVKPVSVSDSFEKALY